MTCANASAAFPVGIESTDVAVISCGRRSTSRDHAQCRGRPCRHGVDPVGCQNPNRIMRRGHIRGLVRRARHGGLFVRTRWACGGHAWVVLRRVQPEGSVRSVSVVVLHELGQHAAEMTGPDDEQMVEPFAADGAHPPLGVCVGVGARTGMRTIGAPIERQISSKAGTNFLSRSRIGWLTTRAWSSSAAAR